MPEGGGAGGATGQEEVPGLAELRVLDGPNLYFARPAVKLTILVSELLRAPEDRARSVGARGRLSGGDAARPGPPGSERRRRYLARLAAHVTRQLADALGTHLAVRARPGPQVDRIVVAFPWRRRTVAEAFGREVVRTLGELYRSRRGIARLAREAVERLRQVEPGPGPSVPKPRIPVVAVTGTNGKTTTVRLIAHMAGEAGRSVSYASTDGVFHDGRLVEEGDYSGFGGAGKALSQPGVDVAVLETARGGILLRGIGTAHNDVAVVTNVSADHLGLHGIDTLDQLAEVKSTILRITRADGWAVLNADDPRVAAMRRIARGRPWLFSLDPNHPDLRRALSERGRGVTVIDGAIAVLEPGRDPRELVALEEVPVTLAGLSRQHTQNAMAAAAAALGIGLSERAVVRGLRSFVLDPESNPGRANLFELDRRVLLIDYAHNEAGLEGMIEVARGLCPPGRDVWLGFSTAGDRSDEILHAMGYRAARGADHIAICTLPGYMRGRDPQDFLDRLRAGALDGGATEVPDFPDELHSLRWLLDQSVPGDVVAATSLAQRTEIFAFLDERGARRMGPGRVRQQVRRLRAKRVSSTPSPSSRLPRGR